MSAPMRTISRRPILPPRRGVQRLHRQGRRSPSPPITASHRHFDQWLKARGIIGLSGIDTRALTNAHPREGHAQWRHRPQCHGQVRSRRSSRRWRRDWPGLVGMDLAKDVSLTQRMDWDEKTWDWDDGYTHAGECAEYQGRRHRLRREAQHPALPHQRRLRRDRRAGDRQGRGHPGA